ncbi:MAG TPA: hypothetical protein VGR79_07670 [Stellaceae bacterium]|nr:hypothetical protein [Stellaceae bacterium]
MREMTPAKLLAEHKILREDPERYIEMISEFIRLDPSDSMEYFSRHHGWEQLGRLDLALKDLDQSIELRDAAMSRLSRGSILVRMGRNQEALEDFNRAESLEPEKWVDCWGPFRRADCHARLGNEAAALADCERLPEGFWSPGIHGEPGGNKAEITAEVRRRAHAAKSAR